jgi:hypothetical protein
VLIEELYLESKIAVEYLCVCVCVFEVYDGSSNLTGEEKDAC